MHTYFVLISYIIALSLKNSISWLSLTIATLNHNYMKKESFLIKQNVILRSNSLNEI